VPASQAVAEAQESRDHGEQETRAEVADLDTPVGPLVEADQAMANLEEHRVLDSEDQVAEQSVANAVKTDEPAPTQAVAEAQESRDHGEQETRKEAPAASDLSSAAEEVHTNEAQDIPAEKEVHDPHVVAAQGETTPCEGPLASEAMAVDTVYADPKKQAAKIRKFKKLPSLDGSAARVKASQKHALLTA